ncbi:MAG: adenosylcobinamide amidohydrolase [Desulfurococcales archaeon]|nr:adenosylcobinamide amidohydrolase [Desulfurococcales archaeon]
MARVRVRGDILEIDLEAVHLVASTGVNGGLRESRHIIIRSVGEDLDYEGVEDLVRDAVRRAGVGDAVVLLTAVDVGDYIELEGGSVWLLATVGLTHPACIDMEEVYEAPRTSTINIVAVSKAPLKPPALLDMLKTVAEAKAATSSDLLLGCMSRPVGTVSDAIAVAAPQGGGAPWSGIATRIGNEAARLVREAIRRGDRRGIDSRLRGVLGIGVEELVRDALAMYSTAPAPGLDARGVEGLIRLAMERFLRDPNTWALLVAARELDYHARAGSIPGLGADEYKGDTRGLVADEVLAASLSLYLQGWKGLMAAYWVDRSKDMVGLRLAGLPGFLDDIAAALVGAALSRVYDEVLHREDRGSGHGGG